MTNAEALIIVFTDVPSYPPDHHTLSFVAAADALGLLVRAGIPLVLCSSRTRAEIQVLQRDLDIHHPFIVEGGGALIIPVGYFSFPLPGARHTAVCEVIEFSRPYGELVDTLHDMALKLRIDVVGFSDMTVEVEEVADDCGLSLLQARLAKLREYGEPFRMDDSSPATRNRLFRALHNAGLRCTRGGRYDYVTGVTDNSASVAMLRSFYKRADGRVLTVGLGNTQNDVPLLSAPFRNYGDVFVPQAAGRAASAEAASLASN